jgi:hypothetical protein
MFETKNLLFNSLSVSFGLFFYTVFIYLCYVMFYKENEHRITKNINIEEGKNVEKEDIDSFDILED